MPAEYLELWLCRDVYHCTPAELRQQDPQIIFAHLTVLSVEQQVRNAQSR